MEEQFDAEMERVKKLQEDGLAKYGFYIHYVPGDENFPFKMNIHTHGVMESYKHLDIQICFPIDASIANSLLHEAVNKIKNGQTFEPGVEYGEIIGGGLKVKFAYAWDLGSHAVLRMILPDKNGKFDGEFMAQWVGTQKTIGN